MWRTIRAIRTCRLHEQGEAEVGDLPPTVVSEGDVVRIPANTLQRMMNVGDVDLVFLCVCSSRFVPSAYVSGC
jgi:mannose-6-phosphate isomerase-like protein (cupin superfamily)